MKPPYCLNNDENVKLMQNDVNILFFRIPNKITHNYQIIKVHIKKQINIFYAYRFTTYK